MTEIVAAAHRAILYVADAVSVPAVGAVMVGGVVLVVAAAMANLVGRG